MAKIIISELQDKIDELNNEKKDLENQLNEALNTIKFLHSDYISLTDKFDKVNQTIIIDSNNNEKKFNEKINELKIKNDQLNDELLTKKEINKLQEEALNRKITLLTKKLEKTEEELESYKKRNEEIYKLEMNKNQINNENIILREDNIKIANKYNDDRKKFYKEIEEYKNKIKKLENENFILASELNDKRDMLEKEHKINFQFNKLDKFLNNTIKEKNYSYEVINEKYTELFKKFENYKMENSKEKNDIMEKYNK
jgi:chromosome segregation ATPase